MSSPEFERLTAAAKDALDRYEKGEVPFQWLVSQLKAVVGTAEPIADPKWGQAMRRDWGRLEIVNAVMYSEKRRAPNEQDEREIAAAISSMRKLLL